MDLRKIFGIKSGEKQPYKYADILHMWEDDYLMIELLPKENLEFIEKETKRIDEFGEEHFDGTGFTDITVIGEKPVKTIEKQIPIEQVESIFNNTELQKIEKVVMQQVGLLEGDKTPKGFGTNNFAVILERESGLLKNIWITGHTQTEIDRKQLKIGLKEFGKKFNFIGVDWYKSEYYDLNEENQIEDYIKNSC
jgi:hypothetical protein